MFVVSLAFLALILPIPYPHFSLCEASRPTDNRKEKAGNDPPLPQAVYLEITETNLDTFPKIMIRRKQYPRAHPFVYENGNLYVDERRLRLTEEGIAEIGIVLEQKIDIEKGRKGIIYIVNFVQYTGKGRVYSQEVFFAADTLPFTVERPQWGQHETAPLKESGEEENEIILSASSGAYETFSLRFWRSNLEVLNISRNGRIDLRYSGDTFSLGAGEEKSLPGGEKTLNIKQWLLDSTTFEYGKITFKTGLRIKNYGKVEVVTKN